MRVSWSTNVVEVDAFLDRIMAAAEDVTPAWHHLEHWYTETAAKRFAGAARWSPLTKKYAAWKERHHPGRGILQLTGEMYDALTEPQVHEFRPLEAVVGILTGRTELFRAQVLNRRRRIMPRLPRKEIDELTQTILNRILGGGPAL